MLFRERAGLADALGLQGDANHAAANRRGKVDGAGAAAGPHVQQATIRVDPRRVGRSRRQRQAARVDWYEGRSLSYQANSPYGPFVSLFNNLLGVPKGAPDAERYEAVQRSISEIVPADSASLAPFIGSMMGIELQGEDEEVLRYLEPLELRERVFGAVKQIIGVLASTEPTVLVFEDLHWSDPTSVDLIQDLMPFTDSCMLMLLAVFRPGRTDPSWVFHETAQRDYDHRYTQIELHPLDEQQTGSLVSHLLSMQRMPEHIRSLILDKTEGNPFFVEEVIRSLLDQGVLVRDVSRGAHHGRRPEHCGA